MLPIFLLALAGTVIAVIVGTVWYSPGTPMGKIHMQAIGFDKLSPEEQKRKIEEAKPTMPKMYGAQMVLSYITAFAVSLIVTQGTQNGLSLPMVLGFVALNWFCFVVPTIGSSIIWGAGCEPKLAWKKFLSDIGSNLVTMLLTGLVASFFA